MKLTKLKKILKSLPTKKMQFEKHLRTVQENFAETVKTFERRLKIFIQF